MTFSKKKKKNLETFHLIGVGSVDIYIYIYIYIGRKYVIAYEHVG